MSLQVDPKQFALPEELAKGIRGKRVFITGSGRDQGLGQAFALAAGLNGADNVGVHFFRSYDDGLDTVEMIREHGGRAFPVQADVTNPRDVWALRSHTIRQMGGKPPNVLICNSGRSERGYLLGRPPKEKEGESPARRRARVRQAFVDNLTQSEDVVDTKVDGFLAMTHLWASEALHYGEPLTIIYISSRQAVDPGAGVPGYCVANWAVLSLPKILRMNLGRHAENITAFSVGFPFVVTSMTEALKDKKKVFGHWQPRMLEPFEAAQGLMQILGRPKDEVSEKFFQLEVDPDEAGGEGAVNVGWAEIDLEPQRREATWSKQTPLKFSAPEE